jgi:hypothetical protein
VDCGTFGITYVEGYQELLLDSDFDMDANKYDVDTESELSSDSSISENI